jgi:hypothetical protein
LIVTVQEGKTMIQRNSRESSVVTPDYPSYRTLLRKVNDALEDKEKFYIDRVSTAFVCTITVPVPSCRAALRNCTYSYHYARKG